MFQKIMIGICLLLHAACVSAQEQELEQLALNIEKLAQFKSILADMQKGYTILAKGYEGVKAIASGNFSLHAAFLDGLLEVSPAVKNYKRVAKIISLQHSVVVQSSTAYQVFAAGNFNAGELAHISTVQAQLVAQGLDNLDALLLVLTPRRLRMGDEERLRQIDRIYASAKLQSNACNRFNRQCYLLLLQRGKEAVNIKGVQGLYGIKK